LESTYKYKAFISYSHQDQKFAKWLHKKIENYKIPKSLREKYPNLPKDLKRSIFLDEEELPTASALPDNLSHALESSELLIVVCSPHATQSQWVDKEIAYFKQYHSEGKVLAILKEGEPNASYSPTYDSNVESFPKSLRYIVDTRGNITNERTEPIAADARKYRGRKKAFIKLIAGILKVDFSDLREREKREARKRKVVFSTILAVFVALSFYASVQFVEDSVNIELKKVNTEIAIIEYSIRHDELPIEKAINLNDELVQLKKLRDAKEETQKRFGTLQSSLGKKAKVVYQKEGAKEAIKLLTSRDALSRKEQLRKEISLEDMTLAALYTETYEFKKAKKSYEDAIVMFFDYDNVMEYADFLDKQNYQKESLELYSQLRNEKLRESQEAGLDSRLGRLYQQSHFDKKAIETYEKALETHKKLAKIDAKKYNIEVASNLASLGGLYSNNHMNNEAKDKMIEVLVMLKNMDENQSGHVPTLKAHALLVLGNIYANEDRKKKAEEVYIEALELCKKSSNKNSRQYKGREAILLSMLGLINNDLIEKAESFYLQALSINKKLAKQNPRAYNLSLASSLDSLGTLYKRHNQFMKAEAYYLEALKIRRYFANINPEVYNSYVARTLADLGDFYEKTKESDKAKGFYIESLGIYRILAHNKASSFNKNVAGTLSKLGSLYKNNKQFHKAKESYIESLKIYRILAKDNVEYFKPKVAGILFDLGSLYERGRQFKKAENTYLESVKIYSEVSKLNSMTRYTNSLSVGLERIAIFYRNINAFNKEKNILLEGLKINRVLAQQDPNRYMRSVAMGLHSLGIIYKRNNEMKKAENAYVEAVDIYRELTQKDTTRYASIFVLYYNSLSNFYRETSQLNKYEKNSKDRLFAYRNLAKIDAKIYNENVASVLINLGEIYIIKKQKIKAKNSLMEALNIYKVLFNDNPNQYAIEYAVSLILNISYSSQREQDFNEAEKIFNQYKEHPVAKDFLKQIKAYKKRKTS